MLSNVRMLFAMDERHWVPHDCYYEAVLELNSYYTDLNTIDQKQQLRHVHTHKSCGLSLSKDVTLLKKYKKSLRCA